MSGSFLGEVHMYWDPHLASIQSQMLTFIIPGGWYKDKYIARSALFRLHFLWDRRSFKT